VEGPFREKELIKKGVWEYGSYLYEELNDEDACIICYNFKKEYAFIPCGHLCMCKYCVDKYDDDKCIICKKEFAVPHKIFNIK